MTLYPPGLVPKDQELWDAVTDVLRRTYRTERHEVAAAIRTHSGTIHVGVHMAGSAGRTSICAEAMALGSVLAATNPATSLADDVDTVLAALYRPGPRAGTLRIIAACGLCRELLVDYCPNAWNYIHVFDETPIPVSLPDNPEPIRGIAGAIAIAPGSAERHKVRDLMPGKNPRPW